MLKKWTGFNNNIIYAWKAAHITKSRAGSQAWSCCGVTAQWVGLIDESITKRTANVRWYK